MPRWTRWLKLRVLLKRRMYIQIVEYHTWWFQHGKMECTWNSWIYISYMMMCSISTCSGYHYFVNFIVDLSKYVYLLNETRVWNHLTCSKNFRMKKVLSLCDLIKVTRIWVMIIGIQICERCSTNYDAWNTSICWCV